MPTENIQGKQLSHCKTNFRSEQQIYSRSWSAEMHEIVSIPIPWNAQDIY